ncbi:hypothetical protein OOK39_02165 [Streptomyces sp. NBC_00264]|uniref:hypothetical protein n=1 Tax=unclassified Streptomyces TaxID=2593676 RepID=UPI00225312FD|nr:MULTISPECIES: hypothetical protein [unclassified Streptomyces]MCX5158105.1 hypothetical protein [Streptomyces sp. NBC_00305]MCX5216628.1 hypothetical protein [Streptomyces sp. NBC_00264]WSX04960.1 hypothetical protein OG355_33485 [Streptomyces sp. NBC_00987]
MGLFGRSTPSFSTEAGNKQHAKNARKNAEKARRTGDQDYAKHCEDWAAEADKQAELSKRLGR